MTVISAADDRGCDLGLRFGATDAMLGDVVRIQLDLQFVQPE